MKKLTLVSGLIVLFAGILIYGCKKESLEPGTQPGSSINVTSSTISSNYSWVGELHNKSLEEIGKLNDFPDVTAQQVDSTIEVTMENSPHVVDSLDPSFLPELRNSELDYISSNSYDNIVDDLKNSSSISSDVATKLYELENIVDSSNTLNEALDGLNSFESEIESSDNFSDKEKTGIIGSSIIARYSLTFWNLAINDTENNWHTFIITETGGSDEFPSIFGRTFRDVRGFVRAFFDHSGKIKERIDKGKSWSTVLSGPK
ncbi:hypothetical protein [Salibacter sp.]|uniref:hypothetical protein n=1 Tax=Salibacter sp. TaxID=2010995 RepID=UPI00287069DA|nr:hypothetical protein [Salibacter sp.]MDR9488105.1 hypothetical protein [Salibacter sp.]